MHVRYMSMPGTDKCSVTQKNLKNLTKERFVAWKFQCVCVCLWIFSNESTRVWGTRSHHKMIVKSRISSSFDHPLTRRGRCFLESHCHVCSMYVHKRILYIWMYAHDIHIHTLWPIWFLLRCDQIPVYLQLPLQLQNNSAEWILEFSMHLHMHKNRSTIIKTIKWHQYRYVYASAYVYTFL